MPDFNSSQHILERRSKMLAQRLQQRIQDTTLALQAGQGRIPYRTKLSQGDALDWWSKHRYDALGQKAMEGMSPLTTAQLDNALNAYMRDKQAQNLPVESSPSAQPINGSSIPGDMNAPE